MNSAITRRTLGETLRAVIELGGDSPAIEHQNVWWSWREVNRAIDRSRAAIKIAQVPDDAAVGIVPSMDLTVVSIILGCVVDHRTVVMLSPLQSDESLATDIHDSSLGVIVADSETWPRLILTGPAKCADRIGLVASEDGDVRVRSHASLTKVGDSSYLTSKDDVAALLLTSGTTGPPKRIPILHSRLQQALMAASQVPGARSDGGVVPSISKNASIVTVPLVHLSGLYALLAAAAAGRRISLLDHFDVDAWVTRVEGLRPVAANLPPACIKMLLDADVPGSKLRSLRAISVGTAPLSPDPARSFESRFGIPLLVVYGATEFSGAVIGWTLELHSLYAVSKRGSVGRPFPGVRVRVADPNSGREVALGKNGVLEVRGAQVAGGDAAWVRTTDRASVDEDGFVWIHGRLDDTIIRGGFKVALDRIRVTLEAHPLVTEAVAVALEDDRLGHVPAAAVEFDETRGTPTQSDLIEHCRSRLSKYEVPVRIIVMPRLPRGVSMKVRRPAVLELLKQTIRDSG